jgi:hypothetical protein
MAMKLSRKPGGGMGDGIKVTNLVYSEVALLFLTKLPPEPFWMEK